jgi:hypothetical protein
MKMSTRGDFYIGRGENAKWIGSIAFDAYPSGIRICTGKDGRGIPQFKSFSKGKHLFDAATVEEYCERLDEFFANRADATRPSDGWPWPWNDSSRTAFSYTFEDGRVLVSAHGKPFVPLTPELRKLDTLDSSVPELRGKEPFPDMFAIKNLAYGERSGGTLCPCFGQTPLLATH